MDTYSTQILKEKLERYCAYQERCHQEVIRKLYTLKCYPDVVDEIVVHLVSKNFLNEERFTQLFVKSKFYDKKWGRIRLRATLKSKNISQYNITQAFKQIEENYQKVFKEVADEVIASITETNSYKKNQKIVSKLTYKGWEPHLIYQYIDDCQ